MNNKENKIHRNVFLAGLTSLFTDISSEMIYPLLQAFVSAIMKNQARFLGPVLGIIEGIAESTASLLKLFSGYYSDKWQNRKTITIFGYSLSAVSKMLFLVPNWLFVLIARLSDRVGKGIRTAPRDAIIAESTSIDNQGKAFGIQRAMDFTGAFLGTIISFILVTFIFKDINQTIDINSYFKIFVIATIPAFIGVCFLFFIKEEKSKNTLNISKEKPKPTLDIRKYDYNLKIFFLAQAFFTLGNSSNQFLLLRSQNLGYSLSSVLLMYILFNLTSSLLSLFFGALSDKKGRKILLVSGYLLYSIVYIAFGFFTKDTKFLLWLFWPIYGLYYSMTEGVEKAFVSDLAPAESKATALGFYNTIVGIGLLPASIIAGILYSIHPSLPFIFGGIMALIAVILIQFFVKGKK